MSSETPADSSPRARRVPKETVAPESVVERQESLTTYLMHRSASRRERFLRRSRTTTIGSELLRAGYLTGCLLLDFLVIPEPIFLVPGAIGWVLAGVLFCAAIGVEGWFYTKHFSLTEEDSPEPPTET